MVFICVGKSAVNIESEELKPGPGPQYNIAVNVNAANYSLTEARRVDMTLYIPKSCQTYSLAHVTG